MNHSRNFSQNWIDAPKRLEQETLNDSVPWEQVRADLISATDGKMIQAVRFKAAAVEGAFQCGFLV